MLKPNGYNALKLPHRILGDGQLWTVSKGGVRMCGLKWAEALRTKGAPLTVGRIVVKYGDIVDMYSQKHHVPAALILATIATESLGDVIARREEPGYVSDDKTPHRVSVGLMQTLLSTATQMYGNFIHAEDLINPAMSIDLGTRYICQARKYTCFDPVAVSASYNAGGLYPDNNIWGLRCYPIGTGKHISKFVQFYGDACEVLGA